MSALETTAASSDLQRWLSAVEASAGSPIEVVETPLSWVFLTNRHAYKVKKPVDLCGAHYHSSARRQLACIDELWLNRRLAEGIYLGVVPITRDSRGDLRLGGMGAAVEWAVKMRRLRSDRSLRWLIVHGELARSHVTALANLLAEFYRGSPPQTELLDDLYLRLRRRVDDERLLAAQLPAKLRQAARRIRSIQGDYLAGARMVLNLRVCDGRVVDGHGDLRPEHVFFERQPAIIDCVEYSPERRRCDALDDLSGLTMECQRLGRADVAEALADAYRRATGDECFPHLEAFYRSLHACERARSAVATAADSDGGPSGRSRLGEVQSYLDQAESDVDLLT